MFDQLSERLQGVFSGFGGKTLTDENIDDAIREVRRALLEADVSLRVIKAFVDRVKDRAVGEGVVKNVNPGQQLVKIVHDELVSLLGGTRRELDLSGTPAVIVLFGLQGSGKTTSAAKLANHLRKKSRKVLLVAADVYRPAAIDQLVTLGKEIDIPVHTVPGSTDVLGIAQTGIDKAKAENFDTVIVDTAGRLQVDTDMMAELLLLERSLKPQEKLLVVDAMTGQEAVNVADTFNTQLAMTGIIVTKLDGDARGGATLSVVEITGRPVLYMGTSEKISGLEEFHPERMATRILGMGDVVTLVERAQQVVDAEEAKAMEEKMRKQSFSLDDFMKVQKQLKMLGSFDQILGMLPIPGMNKDMREMISHGGEQQLKRVEAMYNSMTAAERENPDMISSSRQRRIAKGCGYKEADIAQFLVQFNQMKMMMKQMTKMTDEVKKEQAPASFGLQMPRSIRKKKKKGLEDFGGKFPQGMPPLPPGSAGFPFGGGGGGKGGFPF